MIDFSVPLAGLDRASASLEQTASRIARSGFAGGDSVDLSAEAVALIQARNDFQSNVKVLQTENDLAKGLLNLLG